MFAATRHSLDELHRSEPLGHDRPVHIPAFNVSKTVSRKWQKYLGNNHVVVWEGKVMGVARNFCFKVPIRGV